MNASTRMMMIGLLALAPVLASASSEYAQCLAEQNEQRALRGFGSSRPATRLTVVPRYYTSLDYGNYLYGSAYGYQTRAIFVSDGYADVLAAMVRVCRQFKEKSTPPKFRVVGVKSPSFNRAGNRPQDGSAE